MGIMDMFKTAPVAPVAVAQPLPAPTVVPSAANPAVPAPNPALPAALPSLTPAAPASPLDAHAGLWNNDATKGTAPAPLFDIDPAKLQEAIKSADFTKSIPPDLLAKALAGDAAALQQALNSVAQQTFTHQTTATTKLIEEALNRRDAEMRNSMPDYVRAAQIKQNLAELPIYQHEATRPLIDALQAQLTTKFPKSSADEIALAARSYIAEFARVATGETPADAAATAQGKADDWSGF